MEPWGTNRGESPPLLPRVLMMSVAEQMLCHQCSCDCFAVSREPLDVFLRYRREVSWVVDDLLAFYPVGGLGGTRQSIWPRAA